MTYEPYQCKSCSTVLVLDDRENRANASCPLCLSRIIAIEEIQETWKGFICHRCGQYFSIQASRSPNKCPTCISSSLELAPQDDPHVFGIRHIKSVHATKTSTNLPSVNKTPWQPVSSHKETWKDWMEGLFLLATHEIGFFIVLAMIGSVIGVLYMIFHFLSRAIIQVF